MPLLQIVAKDGSYRLRTAQRAPLSSNPRVERRELVGLQADQHGHSLTGWRGALLL